MEDASDVSFASGRSVGQVECKCTGRMLSRCAWWLSPLLWWQVGHACTEGLKIICPFYKILANSMRQY